MTTKEVVQWVLKAEDYHEKHWTQKCLGLHNALEYQTKCLKATMPPNKNLAGPTELDFVLAQVLIKDHWNDCQDWVHLK